MQQKSNNEKLLRASLLRLVGLCDKDGGDGLICPPEGQPGEWRSEPFRAAIADALAVLKETKGGCQ